VSHERCRAAAEVAEDHQQEEENCVSIRQYMRVLTRAQDLNGLLRAQREGTLDEVRLHLHYVLTHVTHYDSVLTRGFGARRACIWYTAGISTHPRTGTRCCEATPHHGASKATTTARPPHTSTYTCPCPCPCPCPYPYPYLGPFPGKQASRTDATEAALSSSTS
jgi:hypothetical protein